MKNPDIIIALEKIINAFEILGIEYYIGGSIASSTYGISRSTLDIDVVAKINKQQVSQLVEMLESEYYIDEEMIFWAIGNESSFNVIHLETMMKIDIFILKNNEYDLEAFKRIKMDSFEDESVKFWFSSPEDIILNKLLWYKMGDKISDRQWDDVLGILKIRGNILDKEYLFDWANKLKIKDLLELAFQDSGIL